MDKTIIAIIAITVLEGIAIWQGINGAVFGIAIASIAGLGGFKLGQRAKPK